MVEAGGRGDFPGVLMSQLMLAPRRAGRQMPRVQPCSGVQHAAEASSFMVIVSDLERDDHEGRLGEKCRMVEDRVNRSETTL